MGINESEILKITKPEDLFSAGDIDTIKKEYYDLAKKYHPDKGGNEKVFTHIGELKDEALKAVSSGTWSKNGVFLFTTTDGHTFKIMYKKQYQFELGEVFITDENLFYFIKKEYQELYSKALKYTKFLFYDEKMEKEFKRFLPMQRGKMETENHFVIQYSKTPDVVPLRGLYSYFKDGVDPKHVAWIVSSMCNMLCYLYWAKLEHLAINIDSYFVSPEYHSGLLLGNWFYCTKHGEKIINVPASTYALMSVKKKNKKIAEYGTDAELVKNIGRGLMGKYLSKMKFPEFSHMIDWLTIPSTDTPYVMFNSWDHVMEKTFGKRKFIKLDVDINDIYKSM